MKKLQKKPISMREETFTLASCWCFCNCDCMDPCGCPIAPTHQIGLDVVSKGRSEQTVLLENGGAMSAIYSRI